MLTITLTKGLPASGKTTWAMAQISENPNIVRVNKDELRAMMHASKHSKDREKRVLKVQEAIVRQALLDNKHVIVDDTNFNPYHEERMKKLADEHGAATGQFVQVKIESFLHVPEDECIRRDAERPNGVGKDVIVSMWKKYVRDPEYDDDRYVWQDLNKPSAIVVDLDGTLALHNGRDPYDASTCDSDLLHEPVSLLLNAYKGVATIIVSGRSDAYRPETESWLRKHRINYAEMWMRPAGDQTKDAELKYKIYKSKIKPRYRVLFVLDDRNQVVDMWRREAKLPCFQVWYGDF